MSKIGALPPQDVNGFDGVDELHNVEYHMHRGAKSKRRVKKKQTARIKEQGSGPDILSVIQELLFGKRSLYVGIPFVVSGVLVSMLLQLNPLMQRYNPVVICSLAGAVEFRYFPEKSVRAQITIALLVLLSCAVDIFQMGGGNLINPIIAAVVFQILFKLLLLNAFLRNSQGASRTRKYLNRRFRLFMIPLNQPRRIMRDVRGRIIAIGLMQLAAFISYSLLFILFLVYLDFSSIFLGSEWSSSIPSFLVLKLVTTTVVLSSIWYDSDWRLTLWHFGCLGCCINYIRTYITRKRIELKGFPLIYAYSKYRFQVVQFLKFLDVACGMYGWFILSYSFGTRFYSIGSRMQIFCSFMAFSLIVYDLWVVVLVFGVRWLTKRHRIVQDILRESGVGIDSDDSEIEEFGLRMSIEARIERDQDKAALSEARRRLYFARMREEETRWAEKTFDRDARGRRGLTGAVDWVQQSFTWKPKSSNVVHPDIPLHDYNNNNGNNGNGRYSETGEFLSNEDTMEQELTHTHPLMKQLQNHAEFNNGTRTFDRYDVLWKELKSKDDLRIQAVQRGQEEEEEAAKDTITKALQQNPPLKEKTPSYASTIIPPGALTVPTLWSFGKSRIHPGEKPTFLPGGSLGSSGNVRNAELNHKKSTKTASVRFFNSDRGSIMQEDNMEKEWDGDGGKVEIDEMDSDDDHDDEDDHGYHHHDDDHHGDGDDVDADLADQADIARDQEFEHENETCDTVSTTSTAGRMGLNALERTAERRRSRSASPSAIANRRASRRESKHSSRLNQQHRTPSGSFMEMFSPTAKYVEEAGILSAYDVLVSKDRQPLVRRLFDNYCKADQTLDVETVQQLCYDLGIYYSLIDIRIGIKPFVSTSARGSMNYDAFMVWWRSNTDFRFGTYHFSLLLYFYVHLH